MQDRNLILLRHGALQGREAIKTWTMLVVSATARRKYRRYAAVSSVFRTALRDAPISTPPAKRSGGSGGGSFLRIAPVAGITLLSLFVLFFECRAWGYEFELPSFLSGAPQGGPSSSCQVIQRVRTAAGRHAPPPRVVHSS